MRNGTLLFPALLIGLLALPSATSRGKPDSGEAAGQAKERGGESAPAPSSASEVGKGTPEAGQTAADAPSAPSARVPEMALTGPGEMPQVVKEAKERSEKRQAAIRETRAELGAAPGNPEVLGRLVDLLIEDHSGEEARKEAEKFVVLNPSVAGGYLHLGRSLYWLGDYELAELQFERAISMAPKDAAPLVWTARCLIARGDAAGAAGMTEKALAITPEDTLALAIRARALEEQSQYLEAAKLWHLVVGIRAREGSEEPDLAARELLCKALAGVKPMALHMPESGEVKVDLKRFRTVPAVPVRLRGRSEKYMIMDLNAADTVLTAEAAAELSLQEFGGPSSSPQGVGSPAKALLDSIQIGTLAVTDIPVNINPNLSYPHPQIAGILGRKLLSRFLVTIDFPAGTMTLRPSPREPIEGSELYAPAALLVDGWAQDEKAGKFLVDTSTFTPAPVSLLWAQEKLGVNVMSPGVTPILRPPYYFSFTMPELKIGDVKWVSYKATGVDLRSMSEYLGTELSGVLANSLLDDTRMTLDLGHLRMKLERVRDQKWTTPERVAPADREGSSAQPSSGG